MNRMLLRCAAMLVALSPLATASWVEAQHNGEAHSTVPTVVRETYDMQKFMAPIQLTEVELSGRALFAQGCANCHTGTARDLGPLLSRETVERVGEPFIREKVSKGSPLMPGFEYNLEPAEIDQIIAFLKTAAPPSDKTTARD